MRVAQKVAGYSLAEADNLRKACGKKVRELIAKEREKFIDGCERTGYGRELGTQLFDIIEPFADYAFNKSHAFGYGLVAYQTAYLKAHYPVEYFACLLTSVKSTWRRRPSTSPSAGRWASGCSPPTSTARSPTSPPSTPAEVPDGVDAAARQPRARSRSACRRCATSATGSSPCCSSERDANGPFASFHDFAERVPEPVLNKRAVESLIKAGAFDSLGHTRKGLLGVFEHITDTTLTRRRERERGVMSLFGDWGGADGRGDGGASTSGCRSPTSSSTRPTSCATRRRCSGCTCPTIRCSASEAALRRKVEHVDRRPRRAGRRGHGPHRRRRHRAGRASSPRRATRWPCSCSRTSRRASR